MRTHTREGKIRIFGVSLLAAAAFAGAALLWKRRREALLAYYFEGDGPLDELRSAGL